MTTPAVNLHIKSTNTQIGNCNDFLFFAYTKIITLFESSVIFQTEYLNKVDVKINALTGVYGKFDFSFFGHFNLKPVVIICQACIIRVAKSAVNGLAAFKQGSLVVLIIGLGVVAYWTGGKLIFHCVTIPTTPAVNLHIIGADTYVGNRDHFLFLAYA